MIELAYGSTGWGRSLQRSRVWQSEAASTRTARVENLDWLEMIKKVLATAGEKSGHPRACPDFSLESLDRGGYSIVVCEWVHTV